MSKQIKTKSLSLAWMFMFVCEDIGVEEYNHLLLGQ